MWCNWISTDLLTHIHTPQYEPLLTKTATIYDEDSIIRSYRDDRLQLRYKLVTAIVAVVISFKKKLSSRLSTLLHRLFLFFSIQIHLD